MPEPTLIDIAIIGGGPAGLRVAEMASAQGRKVELFEGKRSVARKFLVAGKGGLNLTHGESFEIFATRYRGFSEMWWAHLLGTFSPQDLRNWAEQLGVETFQASSGRIYPRALKAAPLLRRWLQKLHQNEVSIHLLHRLADWQPGEKHLLRFENGAEFLANDVVFALGGGSWPQTGSDGTWISLFQQKDIDCQKLDAANCGWECQWSEATLLAAEGQPLKNLHVKANSQTAVGELMVTQYGLEGGAIYQLGAVLRQMPNPCLVIDFKPTFTTEALLKKMESARGDRENLLNEAKIRLKLSPAACAILLEKNWISASELITHIKSCGIKLTQARPIAEAISCAGGICCHELTPELEFKKYPHAFAIGEMIDWEAPTGGYLMQACFSMATRVGTQLALIRE